MAWYYMKDGWIDSTQEGPVDDDDFCRRVFDGKFKSSTLVLHPVHTRNAWAKLETIPRLVAQVSAGEAYRKEQQSKRLAEERQAKAAKEREREVIETTRRRRESEIAAATPFVAEIVEPMYAPKYSVPQFRCPFCSSSMPPRVTTKVSTAGWIFFILLFVLLCWPICWIGFLMTEDVRSCSQCGVKLG